MNRMTSLAENDTIRIEYEYEMVYLFNKKKRCRVLIGDFYGDPEYAIIGV